MVNTFRKKISTHSAGRIRHSPCTLHARSIHLIERRYFPRHRIRQHLQSSYRDRKRRIDGQNMESYSTIRYPSFIFPSNLIGKISRLHAFNFGLATGLAGTALLYYTVNPLCAALALGNIILYAGVYTPLKQIHPVNTLVGSVVGAIPPMIGWCAATGL
jgi:hypothetical protein